MEKVLCHLDDRMQTTQACTADCTSAILQCVLDLEQMVTLRVPSGRGFVSVLVTLIQAGES